jgi:hypothetical protein
MARPTKYKEEYNKEAESIWYQTWITDDQVIMVKETWFFRFKMIIKTTITKAYQWAQKKTTS